MDARHAANSAALSATGQHRAFVTAAWRSYCNSGSSGSSGNNGRTAADSGRATAPVRGSKLLARCTGDKAETSALLKAKPQNPSPALEPSTQTEQSLARSLLSSPTQNHLLAALANLAAEDFAPLAEHLELVQLRLGDMLYEPGKQLQHVYFPTTAIVSLHYVTESGATAETAGVGNEGVVGIALFMGGGTTSSSAMVHTAGAAYRLSRQVLTREFARGGALQQLLLRYTQALMTQMVQTAVCNRYHSIEQQLSRWLLTALDRSSVREMVMTHEMIAGMLGVRREGVSEAAAKLQKAGCISYRRGHIAVTDRACLESHACECYAVTKTEVDRLLGDVRCLRSSTTA